MKCLNITGKIYQTKNTKKIKIITKNNNDYVKNKNQAKACFILTIMH